jgi:uncharacterized membrane protein YdjX (TVP38/TMEM64 family)
MGFGSKPIKLLIGIIIFFLVSYLFFDVFFSMSGRIESYVSVLPANISTAVIIISLLVADILIPVPSSIVMVASGALFGGFLGGLIALAGSLAGSLINFHISRWLGQSKVQKWIGNKEYGRLSKIIRKYGAYTIILTRMVPLAMESVSSLAGLSNMKTKKFTLLNVIGFSPIIFFYSYTGALFKAEPQNLLIVLAIGFFVPVILWYVIMKTAGGISAPDHKNDYYS